ncbi:GNAT family N-acetyltransferase [Pseudomonas helleri]|uniref:GNAT family N-acetyltransferase n=1 Tax=Pseudomonas helleri TaxID=1608996 RepID=UPI00242E0380|nr:GNAT family N-acetyltransferase [Pseudomonas helleri]
MTMNDISINRYAPGDEKDVLALIIPIQREEFGIEISAEDQPDLMQIQSFYQTGSGGFWLARRQGEVIATIGLKDIGNGAVALRKMFVAASWRGREFGVAKQMLELIIQISKESGVRQIYLGTTEKFLAAHRFYEKHGFKLIERHNLPASFPLMLVDTRFYALVL